VSPKAAAGSLSGKLDPVVRPITAADVVEALGQGAGDFRAQPLYGLGFAAIYDPVSRRARKTAVRARSGASTWPVSAERSVRSSRARPDAAAPPEIRVHEQPQLAASPEALLSGLPGGRRRKCAEHVEDLGVRTIALPVGVGRLAGTAQKIMPAASVLVASTAGFLQLTEYLGLDLRDSVQIDLEDGHSLPQQGGAMNSEPCQSSDIIDRHAGLTRNAGDFRSLGPGYPPGKISSFPALQPFGCARRRSCQSRRERGH
jgi:hypothetical protein